MRNYVQRALAAAALLLALPALAADWRNAPAFSIPARELQQSAATIVRERPTDVVVLLDERRYVFDENHRVTTTSRLIYRVDSPAGVENWAASTAHWQPWYQQRPQIRARVIARDGREHLLDQGLLRDAARKADNQIYDDAHVLEGPLPAIAVGAVIEEEITTRDEKPFFAAGVAYREYIGRPVPVLFTRVVIDAPESLPLKRNTRLLPDAQYEESRANGRVVWTLEQDVIDEQPVMASNLPPEKPGWASVEFSTGSSWEAVASNYLAVTEPRMRMDDARPLIAGLGRPGPGRQEFIAKVVERLHREVRYTGVEFGEARLVPEFPGETLRRKFGDCKDKSTLLVAALRAAGIDAYLALLSADSGQDVSADLPGLGMFDHAIVHVPGAGARGEDLWIDATTEYARVGTLPEADTNRLALVIRPGEKTLVRTPAMKSADNAQIETREFFLAEHGPARVVETTETRGTIELEYRSWYAGADTRERLQSLNEYAESAYRAKAVSRYTHTSSTDFSKYYSMTLDIRDAPVGTTDLNSAAVGVNLGNIVTRLPNYFSEQLEEADAPETRKEDVVFEPYVIEWRYRVHPPEGFRAKPLPPNGVLELGPARLTSEFTRDALGVINANWRFDTVKSRYTPAEAVAFVKAVRELKDRQVLLLGFDHEGAARRADGDYKGALEAYRTLVRKNPRQAMHHVRHAYALLEAGLGTRAQEEARAATALDPGSALAWKALGWILQHDAVGRRFGAGFDRPAAIAAYLKARELDPRNPDIAADLGVLYEHDSRGVRYADEVGLGLAVIEYRKRAAMLDEDEQKSDRYTDNLYYSLLYLHRFAEMRDAIRKQAPSATRRALHLAAVAGAEGSARAIEASRTFINSDSERRSALKGASGLLANLREYALAADLLEAAARGQSTTAADSQRIALLRKVKKGAREGFRVTDPQGVVFKAHALLMSEDRQHDQFQALLSRRFRPEDGVESVFDLQRRAVQNALARQDAPAEVSADLLFASMRVTIEGDDTLGFRAQLRNAGAGANYYVVKEDGAYKLLARSSSYIAPLAEMALSRLDANDLEGARTWLNWARLEQETSNSEDPLAGYSFSRFWRPAAKPDAAAMRTAAALLLADSWQSARALPLLLAARGVARGDEEKLDIELALARVYQRLKRWAELEQVATPLADAWPESALAFHLQQHARIQLGRWNQVAAAAQARLARLPGDTIARRVLVESADARGQSAEMSALMTPLIDGPRATPSDYNEYAWISLMRQPVEDRVVEIARQAYDETEGGDGAITHTLACVYAAAGKPREARDLLLRGMSRNSEPPNDSAWYGFGLVAEAYGDIESARDYYSRVEKPNDKTVPASSLYSMSQARLKAL